MKDKAKALSFFRTVTGKYSKLISNPARISPLEALNGNVAAAEKYAKNAFKIVENEDTVLTYGSTLLRNQSKRGRSKSWLVISRKIRRLYASVMLTLSCSSRQRISQLWIL